jgi:hypothetical protein
MVELLMVAAILAFGLLGLAALQTATVRAGAAAAARRTAASLADGILDALQAEGRRAFLARILQGLESPDSPSGSLPAPRVESYDREGRPGDQGPPFFTVTVTWSHPAPRLERSLPACLVRARVTWPEGIPAAPGQLGRCRLILS